MNIRLFRLLNRFFMASPPGMRKWFYVKNGLKMGAGATLSSDCMMDSPQNIVIGEGSYINRFCQFHTGMSPEATIQIGERTWVGCNTCLLCITHEMGGPLQRAGALLYGSISIGSGCWIGANTTILPNVKIGNGVVIGAGSVVVKDCEDNCLYAGNPARKIKALPV